VALQDKADITTFRANRLAAAKAYSMAGVCARDISIAELHDCFTIAEIVAMEDLGFCERGQGGPYAISGATCANGERPVNLSGGLKSKGHPVGATGVAQIVALRNFLESRNAPLGLAQNLGGSGATGVVTILERVH
jgi:acetyl-CoA C-acetyltransferase